ncbi:MAG: hypothetical protein AAFN93_15450 [Bacteroidota bacterium]
MERTQEELRQIYEDLLALKEVQNQLHDIGQLLPIPLNGKSWEEEKAEYYDKGVSLYDGLLSSQVKSCEIKTQCEENYNWIRSKREESGFWNHVNYRFFNSSEYIITSGGISLEDMITLTNQIIKGKATTESIEYFDQILNGIGTSACNPRASLDLDSIEWNPNNNSLYNAHNPSNSRG